MKRNKLIGALVLSIALLTNCSKIDTSTDSLLNNNSKNQAIRGDNEWDVLGHGYNATGQYLDPDNVSKAPVLDMKRFKTDHTGKVSNPTGTIIGSEFYFGSNASNFVKMLNKERKFNASASFGNKDSIKTSGQYFSASFSIDKTNQSLKEVASRFSYARHESTVEIRKIHFTDDVSADLLKNYLTTDFITNSAVYNAEQLIQLYGTHVLLDISLGGRLVFNFTSNYSSEMNQEKKITKTKGALGFLAKKIGIDISIDQTKEEMTKSFYEGSERNSKIRIYGGSTSGKTISFDKDGNASEAINIGAWEQSVNTTNAFLLDIRRMVPLYHFITDPTKRAQVKAAIEKYITDNQINELGEVPIYHYQNQSTQDYLYSVSNDAILPSWAGWEYAGPAFCAFKSPGNESVPIYEYRHHQMKRHIYSATKNLIQPNWPGWDPGVIAFYAYTKSTIPGTVPVYEFYNQKNECNLYSTNINIVNGYPGWVRSGIAFYAFPSS